MHEILSACFSEYLNMCKYAANHATCEVFEHEMFTFMQTQYGVAARQDLTEAKIFGMWIEIINEELRYLNQKKFDAADV